MELKKFVKKFIVIMTVVFFLVWSISKDTAYGILLISGVFLILFFVSGEVVLRNGRIEISDKEILNS